MDAYDEDPGAEPGPDGSTGARLPAEPPAGTGTGTDIDTAAVGARGTGPGGSEPGRGASGSGDSGPDDAGHSDVGHSDAGHSDAGHSDAGRGESARAAGPGWAARPGRAEEAGPVAEPGAETEEAEAGPAAGVGVAAVPPAAPGTGVAALSPRYQIAAALALAAVAVAAGVHVLMVFLSLAPANTVTKQHGKAVEEWVYPEFEQNWKLFAPNPLQQNIAVQVRAEVRTKGGELRTTGWTDLSAEDGAAIDGNLAPSHTEQNELRRAWDFFTATHGTDNRPVGMRGSLSEEYLRRIVVMRLYRNEPPDRLGVIQQVQIRSCTTNVQPPKWSPERVSDQPVYRLLPWWTVTADEAAGGVR